jgi:hypothetical protein
MIKTIPMSTQGNQAATSDLLYLRTAIAVVIAIIWSVWPMNFALSQDYDRYMPLQSEGPIPEELRVAASKKYAKELAALGDSAIGKAGKARDNFLLQSNFVLEDMLLSGRVVFGDPVSQYITRVKDYILRKDPDLQKRVRIYLVKSPVVNAFATNSGVLLVNMGLIAHLRTEAELAFVLCHEIQHYLHKHPINSYVNAENLKSNARILGLNNADDYIAARTHYSRKLELDADASGFELYKQSGYSLDAAMGVFELLDYADQPFDQMAWNPQQWEWEYMRFPANYSDVTLDTIDIDEGDDDTLSTHPNIAKRRRVISESIAQLGEDKGETFIIGAPEFLDARKRCRFELCDLYLSDHEYEAAIYNCYLLQTEEPESHYLRKVMTQAMYALATYKNARRFAEAHIDADDLAGEFQRLPYFMEMGDREFLTILAVHEAWKNYLADTSDIELKEVADALLEQLCTKHLTTAEWLAHEKPASLPPVIDSLLRQNERTLAANPKEVKNAEEEEGDVEARHAEKEPDEKVTYRKSVKDNNFMEWALTDLFQNERFADAWAKALEDAKAIKDEEYHTANNMRAMSAKEKLRGIHLGIDKLVLVQPIFKRMDFREEIATQYISSENSLEEYKETLSEMARRNDIAYEFLENRNLEAGDLTEFNDVSTMLMWFNDYNNGSDDRISLVNFRHAEANALVERYGTQYFVWNGIVQVTSKMHSNTQMSWLLIGCVLWPALPFVIYRVTKPEYKTLFVTMVFDLEESEALWQSYRVLKAKDKRTAVRSITYDIFSQIR